MRQDGDAQSDMSTIAALAVDGLSHHFGSTPVLVDVSFAIQPGEFAVLLGPNGAGKTTLFSLITRLYGNRSGSIRIFGLEVRRRSSEALAKVGVVFQQPALDLDLTVGQNLLFHAALHGMERNLAREIMKAELERLGIGARAGDKVRQLSGGQRRRVEIARALMHRPRLLLLDEPTVGLDIAARQGILDHVRRLCGEAGLAVLWATHLIDEVVPGDRVVMLHQGRVRAFGGVDEVIQEADAGTLAQAYANLTRTSPP